MSRRWFFSVDVEDPRDSFADGDRFPERVPALTQAYLDLLRRHGGRGTFFFVGTVARRHPDLVRAIAAEGHEIGCHSDAHVPLDRQSRAAFRDDLMRNLEALDAVGVGPIRGYRAPCFSLTERTRWAYEVLAELGFVYSSSVVPARNPLYGWRGFGRAARRIEGVVELPVTLFPFPRVPLGGLYFRVLPRLLVARVLADHARKGEDVFGYHHPYDLDFDQPFPHPDFAHRSPYEILMRRGRREVLPRLELAARYGFRFERYDVAAADQARESAKE